MKTRMRWRRKRKKKVASCKIFGDSDLHISLSLSLGKWRFETKLRDGLISLQSGLHILLLRYAPLTNCKRYPVFKVSIRCLTSLGFGQTHYLNRALMRFDSNPSFNSVSVDDEMLKNGLIYILENGAASNGFINDKQNTQEVFKRESTDSLRTSPNWLLEMAKTQQNSWQLLLKQLPFLLYLSFTSLTDGRVLLHIKMLTTLPHGYPHLL